MMTEVELLKLKYLNQQIPEKKNFNEKRLIENVMVKPFRVNMFLFQHLIDLNRFILNESTKSILSVFQR